MKLSLATALVLSLTSLGACSEDNISGKELLASCEANCDHQAAGTGCEILSPDFVAQCKAECASMPAIADEEPECAEVLHEMFTCSTSKESYQCDADNDTPYVWYDSEEEDPCMAEQDAYMIVCIPALAGHDDEDLADLIELCQANCDHAADGNGCESLPAEQTAECKAECSILAGYLAGDASCSTAAGALYQCQLDEETFQCDESQEEPYIPDQDQGPCAGELAAMVQACTAE